MKVSDEITLTVRTPSPNGFMPNALEPHLRGYKVDRHGRCM